MSTSTVPQPRKLLTPTRSDPLLTLFRTASTTLKEKEEARAEAQRQYNEAKSQLEAATKAKDEANLTLQKAQQAAEEAK